VTWAGAAPTAAEEGTRQCPGWVDDHGNCHPGVEIPVEVPGTTGSPTTTGPGGPTTPTTLDPNRCEWSAYPDQAHWRGVFPEAPPDAEFGEYHCYRDNRILYGPYVPMWIVPDTLSPGVPPPVSPEQAARTLWARVADTLLVPTVTTSPPADEPAVVRLPTFFAVDNWQGAQHVTDCVAGVCLTMDATPSLSLSHGEEGSTATTSCEPGGTRYDRHGASAQAQADEDGACAHLYEHRTCVPDDRGRCRPGDLPDPWEAELHVTWEIEWSGGGQSGTIPPFTMDSDPIEVAVSDVSSVVVHGG
jgi:hypothetical protein